jgi:inner membrane protein
MDPVTHSLTGAALARAGLHRATPLATATLVIAANVPDIDIATYALGTWAPMSLRRGLTHGPVALLVLPLLVAAIMLLYDRIRRRRRRDETTPARAGPLVLLAFVGVLTHSPLDWLNTYGIRLLSPFSGLWFYGDAVFIIDPWLWLLLAAPLVVCARGRRQRLWWALGGAAASALIVAVPQVPGVAKVVWLAGVAVIATWSVRGAWPARGERVARAAVAAAGFYIVAMVGASQLARTEVERSARLAGIEARDVMYAPLPANPFGGELVAVAAGGYHLGEFRWAARPRVTWRQAPVPRGDWEAPAVTAALELDAVRHYLAWSRFPFVVVRESDHGWLVLFRDARYPDEDREGLHGPVVHVTPAGDAALLP